jgi:hypothetical protein
MPIPPLMRHAGLTLCGLCLAATPAKAADLLHLAVLLAPVFTAQQFADLCNTRDRTFAKETSGPIGTVTAYAVHMRSEVLADLSADEAQVVLHTAAEAARQQALRQVRQLDNGPDPLASWCGTTARPFIMKVLAFHDREHLAFDELILQAKNAPHPVR